MAADAASILSRMEDRPLSEEHSAAEGALVARDAQALLSKPVSPPLLELEFDASGEVDVGALLAAVAALRPLPAPAAPPAVPAPPPAGATAIEGTPPAENGISSPPPVAATTRRCGHCQLALSARVRFCRRCGAGQPALM